MPVRLRRRAGWGLLARIMNRKRRRIIIVVILAAACALVVAAYRFTHHHDPRFIGTWSVNGANTLRLYSGGSGQMTSAKSGISIPLRWWVRGDSLVMSLGSDALLEAVKKSLAEYRDELLGRDHVGQFDVLFIVETSRQAIRLRHEGSEDEWLLTRESD